MVTTSFEPETHPDGVGGTFAAGTSILDAQLPMVHAGHRVRVAG